MGCTCGGRGICTVCRIAQFDREAAELRHVRLAHDMTQAALARKPASLRAVKS